MLKGSTTKATGGDPFSETAYAAAVQPKELVIVPGASHTDLYDKTNVIPFKRFAEFFGRNL